MFITITDLAPFAEIPAYKALAMIEDAEAMAVLTAPCLTSLNTAPEGETAEQLALREAKLAAVKAILRAAILRWHEMGTGAKVTTQDSSGPFSRSETIDTRQRKAMFWPDEVEQLRGICASGETGAAYAIDTAPSGSAHALTCARTFGANYCDCGYELTGYATD